MPGRASAAAHSIVNSMSVSTRMPSLMAKARVCNPNVWSASSEGRWNKNGDTAVGERGAHRNPAT